MQLVYFIQSPQNVQDELVSVGYDLKGNNFNNQANGVNNLENKTLDKTQWSDYRKLLIFQKPSKINNQPYIAFTMAYNVCEGFFNYIMMEVDKNYPLLKQMFASNERNLKDLYNKEKKRTKKIKNKL